MLYQLLVPAWIKSWNCQREAGGRRLPRRRKAPTERLERKSSRRPAFQQRWTHLQHLSVAVFARKHFYWWQPEMKGEGGLPSAPPSGGTPICWGFTSANSQEVLIKIYFTQVITVWWWREKWVRDTEQKTIIRCNMWLAAEIIVLGLAGSNTTERTGSKSQISLH